MDEGNNTVPVLSLQSEGDCYLSTPGEGSDQLKGQAEQVGGSWASLIPFHDEQGRGKAVLSQAMMEMVPGESPTDTPPRAVMNALPQRQQTFRTPLAF